MSVFIDEDGNAISRSFVQSTASVDAEPVAWLYEHPEAKPLLRHSRFPMSVPGWTETPLYTEAQMQARADAARREALEEAAKVLDDFRYNDIVMDGCIMRREWRADFAKLIRALKENPNAG